MLNISRKNRSSKPSRPFLPTPLRLSRAPTGKTSRSLPTASGFGRTNTASGGKKPNLPPPWPPLQTGAAGIRAGSGRPGGHDTKSVPHQKKSAGTEPACCRLRLPKYRAATGGSRHARRKRRHGFETAEKRRPKNCPTVPPCRPYGIAARR